MILEVIVNEQGRKDTQELMLAISYLMTCANVDFGIEV
jgi:hypothetical protein